MHCLSLSKFKLPACFILSLSLMTLYSAEALTPDLKQRAKYFENRNAFYYPDNRWTYQHMGEFYPTVTLERPKLNVIGLPTHWRNLDNVSVKDAEGNHFFLKDLGKKSPTDALIIVKDGKIVYERYYNDQTPNSRHQMNSVTKSLVGLMIQPLIDSGKIKRDALVTDYLPELGNSGWAGATVNQVLDMNVSLDFNEDYADLNSGFNTYLQAMQLLGKDVSNAIGLKAYLQNIPKGRKAHGSGFDYITPNTDVACWIAEKVTNKPAYQLIQENVWSKINAQDNAYLLLDRQGDTFCGAGLNASARDMAKLGVALLNTLIGDKPTGLSPQLRSVFNVKSNSSAAKNPTRLESDDAGWDYAQFWWLRNDAHHSFRAIGINGQWLYVDPVEKVVVVVQSADKFSDDSPNSKLILNLIDAAIDHLKR